MLIKTLTRAIIHIWNESEKKLDSKFNKIQRVKFFALQEKFCHSYIKIEARVREIQETYCRNSYNQPISIVVRRTNDKLQFMSRCKVMFFVRLWKGHFGSVILQNKFGYWKEIIVRCVCGNVETGHHGRDPGLLYYLKVVFRMQQLQVK